MKIERLQIDKLPGIHRGFAVSDFDPEITLVVGPNASGKSSLVRAFQLMVAGNRKGDPLALSLEADLRGEEGKWTVTRLGSEVGWTLDGVKNDPPLLPDPRFFHCYWLRIEDLLLPEYQGDQEIVATIRRELTGGYDLDAVIGPGTRFSVGVRHGTREANAFGESSKRVREIARQYEALQKDRLRLPSLQDQIEKGRWLGSEIAKAERAIELLQARRRWVEAEAALGEFPATSVEMDLLRGDEGTRLDKLGGRRKEIEEELRDRRKAKADAEEELTGVGLGEGTPGQGDLEAQRESLQRARELLLRRDGAEKRQQDAVAEARVAAEALGVEGEDLPAFDPSAISVAEKLAVEFEAVRHRDQELDARLEGATDPPDQAEIESHQRASDALAEWLGAVGDGLGNAVWAVVLVLVGSLAAVVAASVRLSPIEIGGGVAAAIGAVWMSFLIWRARSERDSARNRFVKAGLGPPKHWTAKDVARSLDEIQGRLAQLRQADIQARWVAGAREEKKGTARRLMELDEEKRAMAGAIGFDPEATAKSLHEFVRLVDRLRSAKAEAEAASQEVDGIEDSLSRRIESVVSFLKPWTSDPGAPPQTDLPEPTGRASELEIEGLERGVRVLTERASVAEAADRSIARAEEEIEKLLHDREQLDAEIEGVFEEAGLEPGDRSSLDRRLEVLDSYQDRKQAEHEARIAERQTRATIEDEKELIALVEADDEARIEAILEGLNGEAERLGELRDEKTAIETRIKEADANNRLGQAMADHAEAETALEDALESARFAAAGRMLIEGVKREHHSAHAPEILRVAQERFEEFTESNWTLELSDSSGFAARDSANDVLRNLSELSSGTRTQLLLAVRLAWATTMEKGREPLPLFLDEALTASDPNRFREVVKSLARIAEEGRQVIYLCAQPADVQLWDWVLGRSPSVVDLGDLRFGVPTEKGPEQFQLPERREFSPPGHNTPEEYAALLGVPEPDLWASPNALHPFFILRDDLATLHRLLHDWRILSIGQLEATLDGPSGEKVVPDPELRRTLKRRIKIAREWVRTWRLGRGRPIDRTVLEESGAVSPAFIDRASDLVVEEGGDPERVLDGLRSMPRFQSGKVEQLEAWLLDHGYLSEDEALDLDLREARVLLEVSGVAEPDEIKTLVGWLEAGVR